MWIKRRICRFLQLQSISRGPRRGQEPQLQGSRLLDSWIQWRGNCYNWKASSSGSNSMVESQPSKLLVAGPIPVSRSKVFMNLRRDCCTTVRPLRTSGKSATLPGGLPDLRKDRSACLIAVDILKPLVRVVCRHARTVNMRELPHYVPVLQKHRRLRPCVLKALPSLRHGASNSQ